MKMFLAAAALAVALPAAAHAADQPAPPVQGQAPATDHKCCCEEMMAHHGDHQGMAGHQGHDMSQHQQHEQQPK